MPIPRTPPEIPRGGPAYGVAPAPTEYGGPVYRGWYDERPPEVAVKTNGGVSRPTTGPKPLPTLTKVTTGFAMLGLLYGINHWARPTLVASKLEQKGGVWGLLAKVVATLTAFLDHGTNLIAHNVSKGAAHAAAGPAHTLDLMALRWEQLIWHFADFVAQMDLVVGRIVHHIIPHAITQQVAPVKVQVRKLRVGFTSLTADLNALRHWIHTELNRNVKPRLGRVETATRTTLPHRIARGERAGARTQAQVHQHKLWIGKLLPLLTVAGAVGLVLRAFTQMGLNYLRCQNMKGFGNELCASPPGFGRGLSSFWRKLFGAFGPLLGDLLAVSFVPFLLTEACAIVGAIEQLAIKVQPEIDALVLSIEGFVCGGPSYLPSAIEPSDLARGAPLPTGL